MSIVIDFIICILTIRLWDLVTSAMAMFEQVGKTSTASMGKLLNYYNLPSFNLLQQFNSA